MSTSAPRVLLFSHDGLGLGHVRRNARIAAAVLERCPGADVTIVTGVRGEYPWLDGTGARVARLPSLTKDASGRYLVCEGDPAEVRRARASRFREVVDRHRPDVVVVDRHPFGIDGELRAGLDLARRSGAVLVLGLRDVLDDPSRVREEIAGPGWAGVVDTYDSLLVYGHRHLCDHEAEYGVPLPPTYCGVVLGRDTHPPAARRDLVVVSSGGGADGAAVLRLAGSLPSGPHAPVVVVLGPEVRGAQERARRLAHLDVRRSVPDCSELYAAARATVQMAGYNSTYEVLRAGIRPVLVPRRSPRREQAIRAVRLAHLGLADVLDEDAAPEEARWLLEQDRTLTTGALGRARIDLDGADRAGRHVLALVGAEAVA